MRATPSRPIGTSTPADLHWSLGLGLRLGRSKSTQKMVQHINLTFPLGDKYLSGPVVSVLAKKHL